MLPAGLFVPASNGGRPVETHCVLFVVDQKDDGQLIMSEPDCFDDEASADAWAAADPENKLGVAPSGGAGVILESTFTLGRHYDGFNGTGSSVTVVGSSCTGGWWNTSTWWDNRISSTENGCSWVRHWDYPNKGGSSESTYGTGTIDNLTYMNNKAESVSYH